jgi:integrase
MAVMSYIQRRRSGVYEFRRRMPQALAGKAVPAHMRDRFPDLINPKTGRFKREYVRSLDTKDCAVAKRKAHRLASWWIDLTETAVAALQSPPTASTSSVDPQEIGEAVYRQLLAADEAERIEGDDRRRTELIEYDFEAGREVTVARSDKWSGLIEVPSPSAIGMQIDHMDAYGSETSDLATEYRAAYARRDPAIVSVESAIELKRRGATYDKTSPEFQAVALEVLRAHVRAYDDMERRQRGEDVLTPAIAPATARGPLLSEALTLWKAGGGARGAKKPGTNTVTEVEQAVRYFSELHGDMHLAHITRAKAREWRDAIAKAPKGLPSKLRKLPLPKLLERDLSAYPLRDVTTINKMIQLIGAVASKAQREGLLDDVPGFVNPFDKYLKLPADDADRNPRAVFSKPNLTAIFTSPIYAENWRTDGGGGEAAFWFPLIALFTGMRLNEIAQLRICDLARDDDDGGIWFFDIGRDGGRSTKTRSSVRRVPVHPELERIGLLKYREWLTGRGAKPQDPLWPRVKAKGKRPRSAAWSKWINAYLRKRCGITDEAKVFHSFRHTFKRMTRDALLNEELHDALTGHANKGSVGRGYGTGFSIKPLAEAIARLAAPIDHITAIVWREPKA